MDLWRQRLEADGAPLGEPEAITSGLEIRRAAFSPRGDRLAYVKGAWVSNLWRVPVLSDRPANWTDAEQLTFDRNFAVVSLRSGKGEIWVTSIDGETPRQLTETSYLVG